jgi:SAM-dependent methyltransferase
LLPFPDGSFDLVVSTLSMRHWADPTTGLAEIGRVLRADGRALAWDFRPGVVPFHADVPDPVGHARGSGLLLSSATPCRWSLWLDLIRRIELVHAADSPTGSDSR